jgi:hypothetical protein
MMESEVDVPLDDLYQTDLRDVFKLPPITIDFFKS